MELSILHHDSELIAINKPSGLLVHRTALARHEGEAALQRLRDQIGRTVYPVHRLDRPTSGVLLFALNPGSARLMSEEFAGLRVNKTYLAIVRGFPPAEMLIDYPLREELDAIADKKARANKPAQEALTQAWCLATAEIPVAVDRYPTSRYALVRASPKTGRKHQIRRHLRHLGHPIIGDVNHGSGIHNRFFTDTYGVRRLLLACTEISFRHPHTHETVTIRAPLCEDFRKCARSLGWSVHCD